MNSYFSQTKPDLMPYGFVPEIVSLSAEAGKSSPKIPFPAADTVSGGATRSSPPLPVTPVDSEDELRTFLDKARFVLVDFWADWCKGCKTIAVRAMCMCFFFVGGGYHAPTPASRMRPTRKREGHGFPNVLYNLFQSYSLLTK